MLYNWVISELIASCNQSANYNKELKKSRFRESKESDNVRRREKRSSLIEGDQTRSMTTNITTN